MGDRGLLVLGLVILTLEGQSTASSAPGRGKDLSVTLWRVYPDTAVFDWYITLAEKHKMVSCNLTYGPLAERNSSRLVTDFLPKHRSFSLLNLAQNTSYRFLMVCRDRRDLLRSAKEIHFDTGVVIAVGDPKLGAIFSPRRQVMESANRDIRSKYIMGSYKHHKAPVSPHTLMGVSCGVAGLVILGLTAGLVARRVVRAPPLKMPQEVEPGPLDTQLYTTEGQEATYSNRTGSISSATSFMDIENFVDSTYSGPDYSFTEGEADLETSSGGLNCVY